MFLLSKPLMKPKNIKYVVNETEDLQSLAPKFSSIEKFNPYKVSADYFEKLPIEILDKIYESEKKQKFMNLPHGIFRLKCTLPVAASVILIIIALFIINKPSSVLHLSLMEYSVDDVLSESPEIIENMDESLLLETLFSGNSEIAIGYFDDNFPNGSTLTTDEIYEYLSQENLTPEIFNDY
jgi:hypothetical protein